MKSIIPHTLILAVCLCLTSSCNGIISFVNGGDDIKFGGTAYGSGTAVRTLYEGGEYSEGQSEPIYWTMGDLMTIYCDQVELVEPGTSKSADYVVNEVKGSGSTAKIILNSATTPIGLRWNDDGTVAHYFQGVCPSVNAGGICTSLAGNAVEGNLAVSQNTLAEALSGSADAGYVLAPDMKWQLMYGYTTEGLTRSNFPKGETVFITFHPITTAIRFTITNSVAKDLVIKELDLLSEGTQIAGKFKVPDMTAAAADNYPAVVTVTDETTPADFRTVKLEFPENVTIEQGKTFTFTFFLAPISDVSDLKFRIVRGGDDDGATLTTRLGYTDGTGLLFPRCKKSFVKGIMVPEGVQWTIDYEPHLKEWEEGGGGDIPMN